MDSDLGFLDSGILDSGFWELGFLDSGILDSGSWDSWILDSGFWDSGLRILDFSIRPLQRPSYEYSLVSELVHVHQFLTLVSES